MSHLRPLALFMVMLATTGCAFRSQVSGMAVEYNEFVAEATNRQTVINILRARWREPLHFTSFSKVLGTARVEGTAALDVAANGDGGERLPQSGGAFATSRRTMGATNWGPKLGVRINSGTDFEIGINATDDFWKGITTPVAPSTIVHLLRQGWERDLISYLFIHRIEFAGRVTDPNGKVIATFPLSRFANAPDNEKTVEPFSSLMRCRTLYYGLSEVAGRSEYTITFSENVATDFNPNVQREDCDRFERTLRDAFVKELRTRNVTFPEPASGAAVAPRARSVDPFTGQTSYVADARSGNAQPGAVSPNGAGFTATDYFSDLVPAGYKTELFIDVSLRSVEGLILYLGEYVRTVNERPLASGVCEDGRFRPCIPLIVIKPAADAAGVEPFITVDYKGERYIVPSSGEDIRVGAGFSSQVIALVQTMLNLHRSSKDLPSTPLVRVIN